MGQGPIWVALCFVSYVRPVRQVNYHSPPRLTAMTWPRHARSASLRPVYLPRDPSALGLTVNKPKSFRSQAALESRILKAPAAAEAGAHAASKSASFQTALPSRFSVRPSCAKVPGVVDHNDRAQVQVLVSLVMRVSVV